MTELPIIGIGVVTLYLARRTELANVGDMGPDVPRTGVRPLDLPLARASRRVAAPLYQARCSAPRSATGGQRREKVDALVGPWPRYAEPMSDRFWRRRRARPTDWRSVRQVRY